jgi:tRNA pseudouridine55 synthase
MNGVLNLYKEPGMTSHDVVHLVRKKCNIRRVGHTGTLDPLAQGVLPICIGQATRISSYLLEKDKTYRATLQLGITTDTYDREGTIISTRPVEVTKELVDQAAASFLGSIHQRPPVYSALKKDGKKLYEYARAGIHVDIPTREVTIHTLQILRLEGSLVEMLVVCSKGTYIRSLVYDLGELLGCGAHMTALERVSSGPFHVDEAIRLPVFLDMDQTQIQQALIPMESVLTHLDTVIIDPPSLRYLVNGVMLYGRNIQGTLDPLQEGAGVRLFCQGDFYGIGQVFMDDTVKKIQPKFIFNKEK